MFHPPALPDVTKVDPKLPKSNLHPYFKKIYLPFLAVLVLAAGAGLATFLVQRQQRITSEASATNQVDLSFSTSSTSLKPGDVFDVKISIDAKNNTVSAASASAVFDSSKLQAINVTAGPYFTESFVSGSYEMLNKTFIENNRATIVIGAPCPINPPPDPQSTPCLVKTGNGTLAIITMQVKPAAANGSTQISFDRANDKTAIAIIGQDTTALGDSPALDLDIQSTPSVVSLEIAAKFQGVAVQRPDKSISIDIKQQTNDIQTGNATFASDSSGKYTGTITANIPAGTYDLYLKGPAHLRKKFIGVGLNLGNNQVDFTSTPLLAGDVNQDNKVDLLDYSAMVLVYEPGVTKSSSADLNFDGKVDLLDYSLLVTNYRPGVLGD